jgi:hypothetical protein
MIIGINGYAGSGKDTVGEIIKQLQPTERWRIKKFAGKLKDVASIILGIPTLMFEDQQFKEKNLPQIWSNHGLPMTVRDFLQRLGTDALREGLHPNTWVNALMTDYGGTYDIDTDSTIYPNWIITDCRFPNEAHAIKNAGGIIIRVNRPGIHAINSHPSEVALDHWVYDYVIDNDDSLSQLQKKVEKVLKQVYEDIAY